MKDDADEPQDTDSSLGGFPATPEAEALLRDVFTHYGHAAYWGQVLEDALIQALVFIARLKDRSLTEEQLQALAQAEYKKKKTIGVLIKEVRTAIRATEPIEVIVDQALQQRNYLIHRFFRGREEQIRSIEGMRGMVDELKEIQKAIFEGHRWVDILRKGVILLIQHDEEHPPAGKAR